MMHEAVNTLARTQDTLPNDASLGVLFPLVKGIGEVEKASGWIECRPGRHGPQERGHPGHQNPTRRQISRHNIQNPASDEFHAGTKIVDDAFRLHHHHHHF